MASDFPGAVDTFVTHHDNPATDDIVEAADINKIQDSVVAIQTLLRERLALSTSGLARPVGLQPFDFVNGTTAVESGSNRAQPGWFVDASGVCHWQGTIYCGGTEEVGLSGAPAPADSKWHFFERPLYRNGVSGVAYPNQKPLPLATGWGGGESNRQAPWYSLRADGWVEIGGSLSTGGRTQYATGGLPYIAYSLPRPIDNQYHIDTAHDETAGNCASAMVDQYGNLMVGPGAGAQPWQSGVWYNLNGIAYLSTGLTGIYVQDNGMGFITGLNWGAEGPFYLDGISYYAGL